MGAPVILGHHEAIGELDIPLIGKSLDCVNRAIIKPVLATLLYNSRPLFNGPPSLESFSVFGPVVVLGDASLSTYLVRMGLLLRCIGICGSKYQI